MAQWCGCRSTKWCSISVLLVDCDIDLPPSLTSSIPRAACEDCCCAKERRTCVDNIVSCCRGGVRCCGGESQVCVSGAVSIAVRLSLTVSCGRCRRGDVGSWRGDVRTWCTT